MSTTPASTEDYHEPGRYEIRIKDTLITAGQTGLKA